MVERRSERGAGRRGGRTAAAAAAKGGATGGGYWRWTEAHTGHLPKDARAARSLGCICGRQRERRAGRAGQTKSSGTTRQWSTLSLHTRLAPRREDRVTLRVDHALSLSAVVFEIARALVKVLCGSPCHRVCVTIHRLVCGSGEQQDE